MSFQQRAKRGRGRRSGPPAEPVRLSEITAEHETNTQSSVLSPQSSPLRVSAIERQERRQRYNVFVDGEFALALAPEVLAGSGLRTGDVVTTERLRDLSLEELRKRTMDAALRLLAARPRSEAEVRRRLLRRGLPHDVIVDTIARLREYGYLNDAEFARFWVESRSGANPRGRYVVRRELRAKGVDQETVDTALEGLTEEASAAKAARKKARSLHGLEYRDFYTRLAGYLVRRGFGYDVVRQTVNDLWKSMNGESPDDEDWMIT